MIKNPDTCRAYAIRSYPDGRKDLFLRSILGYVKWHDPFLDPKNGYVESIISLFESKKDYAKWHNLFLIRKIVMRNDIAGISVGAYCIRPLKTP